MVTEVNTNDALVQSTAGGGAVERVSPVRPVDREQKLPGSGRNDGKALPPEETETPVEDRNLEDVARDFNQQAQLIQRDLNFSVDEDSGISVIKVLDRATQEVIRQIPGDEALRFARALKEGADLKLFNSYT